LADQTITPKLIAQDAVTELAAGDYEDLTAANDGVVTPPKDGKYLLHFIDAAGGATVTITGGDGPLGSQGDIKNAAVMTINLHNFAVVESARVKQLSGSDIGKIRITTDQNIKAACVYFR
jgi:hypothetical protein